MTKSSAVATAPKIVKRAASERIEGSSKRDWLRVSLIRVDPEVQRRLRKAWAREISVNFDPDRIRVIVVSHRSDGNYYVIDGQHRVEALKMMGYEDQLVDCSVFDRTQMSDAQVKREDARLFIELNKTLQQQPIEKFLRLVTAGDPTASAIARILASCGLAVAQGGAANTVACVAMLQKIYAGMGTGRTSPEALNFSLTTVITAWGRESANFQHAIVGGLALLYLRYAKELDPESLVKKLQTVPGGAMHVVGAARTLYAIRHIDVSKCAASVIADIYNRGRKGGKLESWWK